MNFAEAVVRYFVMFATLGIPLYGVRQSARCRDDKLALSTLAVELFALNTIMTVVAAAAFSVFMVLSEKARSDPALFWICAFPMLLMPIGLNWLLEGLEEYVYITMRTLAVRICIVVAVFLFVRTQDDFRIYALMAALNTAGASLLNLAIVRKRISVQSVDWRELHLWRHVKPVLIIFSLGGVVSIYTSLNTVMLGYMTTDTEVGFYSVADRVVKVLVMLVTSMGVVLVPRTSYYVQHKRLGEYRRLATIALRFVSFISFPTAVGLIVVASVLVPLLSGHAFKPAVPLVQIMGLNVVMIALGNFMGYQVLYPQGREKLLLYSAVCGALCNFALNCLLIPRWHALGAAFSTLATETCVTGVRIMLSGAYSDFAWPLRSMFRYGLVAMSMAVVVLSLRSLLGETALCLPVYIGAGAAFYVGVMWMLRDRMLVDIRTRLMAGVTAVTRATNAVL
ncbi:MAG: flippase [Phycisphaerales bacterium]|nr:MAG: flippase [Phycisphaerales bacterium]